MLNIILGKENLDVDNYVHDVNKFFPFVGFVDSPSTRLVLERIEQGSYLSIDSFIDKYGYKLNMLDSSTGSKTLILIANSDKIINGVELGQNAFELLIQSINGKVYFPSVDRFELPEYFNLSNILVNGEPSSTVLELENRLWKE